MEINKITGTVGLSELLPVLKLLDIFSPDKIKIIFKELSSLRGVLTFKLHICSKNIWKESKLVGREMK